MIDEATGDRVYSRACLPSLPEQIGQVGIGIVNGDTPFYEDTAGLFLVHELRGLHGYVEVVVRNGDELMGREAGDLLKGIYWSVSTGLP